MPVPIRYDASAIDLGPRQFFTTAVAASPTAATETTIATLTCTGDIAATKGVFLEASFSVTIGTSGVSATIKIRQTNTSGATVFTTGANTVTAANLYTFGVNGVDASPVLPGQVYVLTLTIGSGAATSTVSAVAMWATVI